MVNLVPANEKLRKRKMIIKNYFKIKNKMNKKVLITGCSGFVGFHISKFLLENNWEVVGIDVTTYYDVAYKKEKAGYFKNLKIFLFIIKT